MGGLKNEWETIWKVEWPFLQSQGQSRKHIIVKKLNEQQDTINDLNGELEESSAFIIEQRKEIQTLKEENKQLRKELNAVGQTILKVY